MSGWIIPVIIGVLVLIGIAAYFGHLAAKKRREELAALAAELGWSFSPDRDPNHDEKYHWFGDFRSGHSRNAFNTLRGDVEVGVERYRVKGGDFRFSETTGSGKNRHTTTYTFSYLIWHLPYSVPDLQVRPEGFFDRISGALGFDDIDFESEEFSRKFHVKSSDKRFAYDLIHPRMMEFLMSHGRPTLEVAGGCLLLCEGRSSRWSTQEFRTRLEFGRGFFSNWPEHLVDQLRG